MATRDDLRDRILLDLERTGSEPANFDGSATWSTVVENCISDAIRRYQSKRFFFNESRSVTFLTAQGTDVYPFATIGTEFYGIDIAAITAGGSVFALDVASYADLEVVADANSATQARPTTYAYINRAIRLYPMPDAAYSVRIAGHVKTPEPANGADTANDWINEAFELIRCRAKLYFATHIVRDPAMAQEIAPAEQSAYADLRSATTDRVRTGYFAPTQF